MTWEDKKASLQKAGQMIAASAAGGADCIIFPEMSLTGFSMHLAKIGESGEDSWSVQEMQRLAVKHHIGIGFGWAALPELGEEKGTNRFTFIDKEGKVLGEYSKLHPFSYGGESAAFRGGEELVTFPFMGRWISLFVCYDLRFPEIFQAAAGEADIFLVIANWPESRSQQWKTLLQARAMENQAYVVGVNCVGERDGISYTGDSAAFDVLGNTLGELSRQEGILICELEDRAWELRDKFRIRQDRREDLYCSLYRKGVKK